jgi:hypothetical protein
MLTETQWIVVVGVVAVVAMAAIAFFMARSMRRRHAALRSRFGPEYEREVEQHGSVARAERELLAREKRIRKQQLHPLSASDRVRYTASWHTVQARFVEDPSGAVQAADELIQAVMTSQGYDIESFDQRVADLSVDHAHVVQHYRAAHDLAETNRQGRADTEELRQAMVHYRALFADLLEQQPGEDGAFVPEVERNAADAKPRSEDVAPPR